jgi:site-specific DNA-methyltransferase (adenine-specific)
MHPPTQPMRTEAAGAGVYDSPGWGRRYPKIQILTVQELLNGKEIAYPHQTGATFRTAVPIEEDEGPPQEEQLFDWA